MYEQAITVTEDGHLIFIYDDALAPLLSEGKAAIRRASHVEPTADGRWTSDMSPSGGPILGPFALRGEAIDAEVGWLRNNHPQFS